MYVKLFTSIYQGTLRGNSHGLLVFTNILAHADTYGIVDVHPKAIAEEVGLTIDQVNVAIGQLEAPDPESRSPENEGKRIVRLDEHRAWGWHMTNYAKYRAIRNEDDRREQNKLAQARWREKNNITVSKVSQHKPSSAEVSPDKPMQKQKQKEKNKETGIHAPPNGVADSVWQDWMKIRRAKRLPWTETAWAEIQVEIVKAGLTEEQAIRECCARGWGSFRADWHAKYNGNGPGGAVETVYQRSMRERVEEMSPRIARKNPNLKDQNVIDDQSDRPPF